MNKMTTTLLTLFTVLGVTASPLTAQDDRAPIERNVVYGMVSGAALLMDVYHPPEPNGVGIVWINGSGFGAPRPYEMWQLKRRAPQQYVLDAGYTVFVINHRGAPMFRYPAGVKDAQRAVRFVRYNAERWGIDPDRIGGMGHSSGANLVVMLATMDGEGRHENPDPVERESSRIQAAVSSAGPMDFTIVDPEKSHSAMAMRVSYIGSPARLDEAAYRDASPVTYVTPDDAPILLIHGQNDRTVRPIQSDKMYEILQEQGVESLLVRVPGAGHGANDPSESARWLNRHLLEPARAEALESLIAAHESFREARRLAWEGKIVEAVAGYGAAQEQDERLTLTSNDWNGLCWQGGLWENPEQVIDACDRAVESQPDNLEYHDSRGLVRALLGDTDGAIEDLEFFIDRVQNENRKAQRQGWVDALRAGENPFTSEMLKELRG
jgi:acetyl esterase/lipase